MIVLDSTIREVVSEALKCVESDPMEHEELLGFLEAVLLDLEDQRFFLALCYRISMQNDPLFSHQLFETIHSVYRSLARYYRSEAPNKFLDRFFLEFFFKTYVVKSMESIKAQERAQTAQRVLRHLSMHQEKVLHTHQLMIANVSHEMRTSLAAIEGYGNIVQEEKNISPQGTKNYLDKIQTATKSLTALVGDILSISKLNSGQLEIEKQPFWIDEVMIQAIDSVIQKAHLKGLKFQYDIPMFSSQFYGDGHRIFEIVSNLLSNAVKYTPKGSVSLEVIKNMIDPQLVEFTFAVEDSGVGLSEEEQESIFESYVRHNNTEEGLGLGLYISKQLAQRMGGELTVKSQKGQGSRFAFVVVLKRHPLDTTILQGLSFCFLEEYQSEKYQHHAMERFELFKSLGADIKKFSVGEKFSNELFIQRNSSTEHPDVVTIVTGQEAHYKGYDELIGYVKHFGRYEQTAFIAEGVERLSEEALSNFDRIFTQQAPLSYYISLAKAKIRKSTKTRKITTRILAVDDIATNLDLLRLFVKKRYPDVILDLALGAKEAIAYYEKEAYDLLLLDLKMPEIDGFKLYALLKEIKPLPATYALTADAYKQTHERVAETGFDGILTKPLVVDRLYQIIEERGNVQDH